MSEIRDISEPEPGTVIVWSADVGYGTIIIRFMSDDTIRVVHDCALIDERVRIRVALILSPTLVVEQEEPLTIVGAIFCPDCGLHGFVRNGKWMPA